jgi:hypothetical protein
MELICLLLQRFAEPKGNSGATSGSSAMDTPGLFGRWLRATDLIVWSGGRCADNSVVDEGLPSAARCDSERLLGSSQRRRSAFRRSRIR